MLPFHEAALFWSTSLNNMIPLPVLKSRLELRRSAVAQMALQRRGEGGQERGRGGGDGKEKRAVIPNWLTGVIGERLPQCMQKSLIFLCSLVWQLKRLEMTLSISQAHIGDIYKLPIADTQARRGVAHKCACTLLSLALRNVQRPFLTAGILPQAQPPND